MFFGDLKIQAALLLCVCFFLAGGMISTVNSVGEYSWIECPVQAHKKIISHETERATTNLNTPMEISQRGASNGAGRDFISSFFGELFLKNR